MRKSIFKSSVDLWSKGAFLDKLLVVRILSHRGSVQNTTREDRRDEDNCLKIIAGRRKKSRNISKKPQTSEMTFAKTTMMKT